MNNAPPRAVVCYSKSEIYARLAWLLQPAFYGKLGPAALIAIQTDGSPWPEILARANEASETSDPYAKEAAALRAAGFDPVASLLDEALRSVGEDRDLICLLNEDVYGVLRSPVSRPAEPEAFAHSLITEITRRTSFPLWGGVAVSAFGDTPGLLMSHCDHALAQARQLGTGQLVVFDEVDRAVVQMQLAEARSYEMFGESTVADTRSDLETVDSGPVSLVDKSKLPINHGTKQTQ